MQLMDRTMQQDVAERMAGAAFSRYLGSLSDEAFEQAIAESEQLQAVDFSLRQDRAAAKHLPAPEIQEWLLKMSLTGSRAFSQLRDKLDATLSVDYRGEKLPLSAVRGKAEDPDPQVRYDAYKRRAGRLSADRAGHGRLPERHQGRGPDDAGGQSL